MIVKPVDLVMAGDVVINMDRFIFAQRFTEPASGGQEIVRVEVELIAHASDTVRLGLYQGTADSFWKQLAARTIDAGAPDVVQSTVMAAG